LKYTYTKPIISQFLLIHKFTFSPIFRPLGNSNSSRQRSKIKRSKIKGSSSADCACGQRQVGPAWVCMSTRLLKFSNLKRDGIFNWDDFRISHREFRKSVSVFRGQEYIMFHGGHQFRVFSTTLYRFPVNLDDADRRVHCSAQLRVSYTCRID